MRARDKNQAGKRRHPQNLVSSIVQELIWAPFFALCVISNSCYKCCLHICGQTSAPNVVAGSKVRQFLSLPLEGEVIILFGVYNWRVRCCLWYWINIIDSEKRHGGDEISTKDDFKTAIQTERTASEMKTEKKMCVCYVRSTAQSL